MLDDLRYAIRSLAAVPTVTLVAMLTLALGIGATTAIFSVAYGLVLRKLPVGDPRSLVTISSSAALQYGFQAGPGWSYAMWERLRERSDTFDGALAWMLQRLDLSPGGEMQPANVLVASGDFFRVLGVQARFGRTFTAADDLRDGGADGAVAVIGHDMWQRRFNGRGDLPGSTIFIEGAPVTIVGIAPESFKGIDAGQPFDVAIPFATDALIRGRRSVVNSPRMLLLTVLLRLKPRQSIAEATAALRSLQPAIVGDKAPRLLEEPFVVVDASTGISDRSRLRQQYQFPLAILALVSGCVLLIVCLNTANLLLSRASARSFEFSVRMALGAAPWRLIRQSFVEAATLAAVGTLIGLLLALLATRGLVTQLPLPAGTVGMDLTMDWRQVAFLCSLTGLAVLILGTVPALYASRVAPADALRAGGRETGGRRARLLSSGLVVAQVALSIVLLSAAGLFVRTMNRLADVPFGFDPTSIVVVAVNQSRSNAPAEDRSIRDQRLIEAFAGLSGVEGVAASIWTPFDAGGGLLTDARGRRADISSQVAFNFVTPGWFRTYDTPLLSGRDFNSGDGPTGARVAIINRALSRRLFADGEVLGGTIHAGPCSEPGCTVVGVVADAVYGRSLRDAAPPTVYMPLAQAATLTPPNAPLRISVRTADPSSLTRAVAERLRAIDPQQTFGITRLEEQLYASVAQERLLAVLSGFFGLVALLLSSVGLYGVTSYAVSRRRAEIGIRLAIGGQPQIVARRMLQSTAMQVIAGAVIGILAALWLSRFVAPLLYGLEPHDPTTLAGAVTILAAVAALAAWIPAARAVRVDPARVLREN
jgi:putative ABC transport system permease protein